MQVFFLLQYMIGLNILLNWSAWNHNKKWWLNILVKTIYFAMICSCKYVGWKQKKLGWGFISKAAKNTEGSNYKVSKLMFLFPCLQILCVTFIGLYNLKCWVSKPACFLSVLWQESVFKMVWLYIFLLWYFTVHTCSWSTTYDDLLSTNDPFTQPIPLPVSYICPIQFFVFLFWCFW